MDREGESFIARWSRLKQAGGAESGEDAASATEAAPEQAAGAVEARQDAARPAEVAEEPGAAEVADLPPIESLDKDSDFTVFMKAGVPEELKRLALRKLWTTDPVLANLDGLLEYGEDFGQAFKSPGVVATLYRVGQGMPAPIKEIARNIAAGAAGADEGPRADAAAPGVAAPDVADPEIAGPAAADSPAATPDAGGEEEAEAAAPADDERSDAAP